MTRNTGLRVYTCLRKYDMYKLSEMRLTLWSKQTRKDALTCWRVDLHV